MSDDDFNMSMRKFLKQVGVTGQQEIEAAMRAKGADGKAYTLKATIVCEELGLSHEVTGEIKGN